MAKYEDKMLWINMKNAHINDFQKQKYLFYLNPLISSSHVGLISKNRMVQMTCKSNFICSCKECLEYIDLKVMFFVLMLMSH
jgi:hypothetical protein